MCLLIFSNIDQCAAGIGRCLGNISKDCASLAQSCGKDILTCTKNLLGIVLLLPGILLGAAFVGAVSLLIAAVKLVLGTYIQADKAIRGYCGVIHKGVQAYQGGPAVAQGVPVAQAMERERIPVQVPFGVAAGATMSVPHPRGAFSVVVPQGVPPGGTFWCELAPSVGMPVPQKAGLLKFFDGFCSACAAEVYCFCSPCYAVSLIFIPITLALSLVFAILSALSDAVSASCLPVTRLLNDWWPAVHMCVQKFDRKSSAIAFGLPGKFLLCVCAPEGVPVVELV